MLLHSSLPQVGVLLFESFDRRQQLLVLLALAIVVPFGGRLGPLSLLPLIGVICRFRNVCNDNRDGWTDRLRAVAHSSDH